MQNLAGAFTQIAEPDVVLYVESHIGPSKMAHIIISVLFLKTFRKYIYYRYWERERFRKNLEKFLFWVCRD